MTIKQGDAYDLPINLKINKAIIADELLESIDTIEFCFSNLEPKLYV